MDRSLKLRRNSLVLVVELNLNLNLGDMDLLILSCKRGDLTSVKHLVEQREINLNFRDKWDSTPLYYACLCGHTEIVQYLLENGARCEAYTFDGERCVYGALNNEIRNLLRNFKMVVSNSSDLYVGFLKRIMETHEYSDFKFVVHGKEIYVHRCILSARSNYFNEMFHNKWLHRTVVHINNQLVKPSAFNAILRYIYTGMCVKVYVIFKTYIYFEFNEWFMTGKMDILIDQIDDCAVLAKQCQLTALTDDINEAVRRNYLFSKY
ncbi:Ankyrin repeat and BTB/POZ domain-containing protein 1 [Nymphon striatum]|nr:Ankyrin repeat and BTB/POZ domain-containing protein 1 [Nymphon striatum]